MKKIILLTFLLHTLLISVKGQIYFYEDFSSNALPTGWQNLDQDNDSYKWKFMSGFAVSDSWYNNNALTPNNWLITKAIDLSQASGDLALNYAIAAYDPDWAAEHYEVRISTTTSAVASFGTVLYEETLSQGGTFLNRSINLNSYAGQTIYLAFIHNETTDQYKLALDDIMIVGPNEIAISEITTAQYIRVGNNISVTGKVVNYGISPLTSYEVSYNIDNGTESPVYTVTGINVQQGSTHQFTHNISIPTTVADNVTLNVTVGKPNGVLDGTDNNVGHKDIVIYNNSVEHRVLMEHFTTANCSNCPSATSQLNTWLSSRPDVIWLSHHDGYYTDGLTIPASTTLTTFYNDGGSTYAPGIMLDRRWLAPDGDPGPVFSPYSGNPALIDQVRNYPAFVSVNFKNPSFNSNTRVLTLTVSGTFVNSVEANNLRLSLYAREDNLKTTPGQAGSSSGVNYIHNHVMRAAISGVWGETNVITSGTEGSTYSKTFTYTIPTTFNLDNLSFIAFVSEYNSDVNQRNILNAKAVTLNDLISGAYLEDETGIDDNTAALFATVNVFPNPTDNQLYIQTDATIQQIDIFNINGQQINTTPIREAILSVGHLADGLYLLRITTENGVVMKKFIKN